MRKIFALAFLSFLGCRDITRVQVLPIVIGVDLRVFSNIKNDADSLVTIILNNFNHWRGEAVTPKETSVAIECTNCPPRTALASDGYADPDTLRFILTIQDSLKAFNRSFQSFICGPGYGVVMRDVDIDQYYFRVTWVRTYWSNADDDGRNAGDGGRREVKYRNPLSQ